MGKLHDLWATEGQSPWLDNLRRDWIQDGTLQAWVDRGVRGVTSNPTIFQKAMSAGTAYDEQFRELITAGCTVDEAYWRMVDTDIRDALRILRPVHDTSGGTDGFVSLELAPDLARDTVDSVEAARRFHEDIAAPNLMVKVPGTAAGVTTVKELVAEGRNINVTLIFGLPRYVEVMEAYIEGLEHFRSAGGDLATVHGVASFFISRVDTEVDRRLEAVGTDEALALRGRAAVAQGKLAYRLFREVFSGHRWKALAQAGAHVQRPLWASTSTKNPAYPKTLYVDTLIGPDTVNTMPEGTLDDFEAVGTLARTVDVGADEAQAVFDGLAAVGIDMADVATTLEDEGVASFATSFDELAATLEAKAAALR
jgi:transaldolase